MRQVPEVSPGGVLLAGLVGLVVGCASEDVPPPAPPPPEVAQLPEELPTLWTPPPTPAELQVLFAREWESRLREDPLFATATGDHRFDDLLPEVGPQDQARRAATARAFLEELDAFDPDTLSLEDQTSLAILRRQLEDRVAAFEFGAYQIPFTADDGFHTDFADLPGLMSPQTVADHENYLARLRAFPAYLEGQLANLREGLARGMTLPRAVLQGYESTIAPHVVEDPRDSVFHAPFEEFAAAVPAAEQERLRQEGARAIQECIVPGYRKLLDFMTQEYIPQARATLGCSELPRGREYYAHLVRHFTTLDLDAEEIHRIGLDEVARIQEEMEQVIAFTGFDGDFAAFLDALRTDPRFYATSPEELLREAAYLMKKMEAELPRLFGTLPRLPCAVAPVPRHLAPRYTAGRYVPAARGSTQPGYYWVNTYALESRPLYALEALTLHEAVPGHHLQIALAREQEDLPPFRRFSYVDAFGEGWGLYAERLGLEAGFYTDPYRDFGRLTYEMWRACRLVVDTGIHALGWSRDQARDYLAAHTALSLHEVETETDRYVSWPGQALAYKLGELKIRELRRQAEEALGPRFDLRDFHDAVLGGGAVPLPVLEARIQRFLAERRDRAP